MGYDFTEVESPEQHQQAEDDSGHSVRQEEADNLQSEPVRLDADMHAHMAQLIERAARNQVESTDQIASGTKTLRSAGKVLTWNPEMNADNPVLHDDDDYR